MWVVVSILTGVCMFLCSAESAKSRQHNSVIVVVDADVKLGRCVVGTRVQVEFTDGCPTNTQGSTTTVDTCDVVAGVITLQVSASLTSALWRASHHWFVLFAYIRSWFQLYQTQLLFLSSSLHASLQPPLSIFIKRKSPVPLLHLSVPFLCFCCHTYKARETAVSWLKICNIIFIMSN